MRAIFVALCPGSEFSLHGPHYDKKLQQLYNQVQIIAQSTILKLGKSTENSRCLLNLREKGFLR